MKKFELNEISLDPPSIEAQYIFLQSRFLENHLSRVPECETGYDFKFLFDPCKPRQSLIDPTQEFKVDGTMKFGDYYLVSVVVYFKGVYYLRVAVVQVCTPARPNKPTSFSHLQDGEANPQEVEIFCSQERNR